MATLVLQAAGAFLGGFLGPVGSAIGAAAGSMAGYMIDRSVIISTVHNRGPRLQQMRPFTAEEGAPVARVFGTARISGTLIWATRFEEDRRTRRQGFKGGPRTTEFSYYANAAFGLCEGPIAGVRRVWADGRELDLTLLEMRVHTGAPEQEPDPLIEAKQGEGNAPAYRGTAYVVFERLPLDEYGNRLPQLQFEVMRPVGGLAERIRAVALIPGATDFGLETKLVTRSPGRGETQVLNRHVLHGATDLDASLDELEKLCPNLVNVALVVTWFGDDLRAGACRIRPMVVPATEHASEAWKVSGLTAATAPKVSQHGGASAYGGTPSDASVIAAIAAIKARGWKVTLYPFVMMDVPAGNGLPDPYGGGEQAPYPWRGRITCHPAPGRPGTADKTAAARSQVEAFTGGAGTYHFPAGSGTVGFSGEAGDWGYRRMVLHYAHLALLAGGVDGFLIGSELRGLTTLRDAANAFPFVEALAALAGDVRAVLGPAAKLTYGADWSEYFGHQPAGGSGDVFFHLDPLWAHEAIDAVGIDNYMPLSDWREADHAGVNPDGFAGPYDADGLRAGIVSGEGFDWYYAGAAAREGRMRSSITDGAAGQPWVFRYKDIHGWWSNAHYDRPSGVEAATPTAWVPRSKPVWFTELGCAAVDKGPNQPNVFPDPKSAEDAIPYFSDGGRSDAAQRRFIEAHLDHWDPASDAFEEAGNLLSPVYGGRMVDPDAIFLWAWDARPFPAFPLLTADWADGANWLRGHWLNGRLAAADVGAVAEEMLAQAGLDGAATGACAAVLPGYVLEEPGPTRAALEPLTDLFDLAVFEEAGRLVVRPSGAVASTALPVEDIVVPDEDAPIREIVRTPDRELPSAAMLAYRDAMADYESGTARTAREQAGEGEVLLSLPAVLEHGQAQTLVDGWLRRAWLCRETQRFAVPAGNRGVAPGALVQLEEGREHLVLSVEGGLTRTAEARRIVRLPPIPERAALPVTAIAPTVAGRPLVVFLDLPMAGEGPAHEQFRVASFARPWRSQQIYASPDSDGYEPRTTASQTATIGELRAELGPGFEGRLDQVRSAEVALLHGALSSVPMAQLLNGANAAAVRSSNGTWEVLQFQTAEEVAPSEWRLDGLLRGQLGTGDAAAAGAEAGADFVLLDEAVVPAGLRESEAGLALNWRVGPAGHDFTDSFFVTSQQAGGVRALMPLRPVHLRAAWQADGSLQVTWIRRGRIGADSWLGEDIPLGEATESYRITVKNLAGAAVRQDTVAVARWTYAAAEFAADFAVAPAQFVVEVHQISQAVGDGLPAEVSVTVS